MKPVSGKTKLTKVEPQDVHPYWLRGHEIIEKRLATAVKADPQDAPFPLAGDDAKRWFHAQAEAYRDALEMMGVPEEARAALEPQGEASPNEGGER